MLFPVLAYTDVRTVKFFPPAESWLVNSNLKHANRMQGKSDILYDSFKRWHQSHRLKNTRLPVVFSTLCLVFGNVVEHKLSCLIDYLKSNVVIGTNWLTTKLTDEQREPSTICYTLKFCYKRNLQDLDNPQKAYEPTEKCSKHHCHIQNYQGWGR